MRDQVPDKPPCTSQYGGVSIAPFEEVGMKWEAVDFVMKDFRAFVKALGYHVAEPT